MYTNTTSEFELINQNPLRSDKYVCIIISKMYLDSSARDMICYY